VFTKLDSNNQDGVRYVLDIKGSLNAATASKCTAAAPTIQVCCSVLQCVCVYACVCNTHYSLKIVSVYFYPRATDHILEHTVPHCNTLQHTATHCSTLQHTATHCNTLQHTATHCSTLQRTVTHCNTLQRTASRCITLHHTATHCNTLQHIATHYNVHSLVALLNDMCVCVFACVRV